MEELTLAVPGMWADHHVITVRELLRDAGISSIVASARDASVRLTYDPSLTSPERITALLNDGGYPAGEGEEPAASPTNKPAWATAGVRVTATNSIDLIMSGDHRKY